MIHPPLASAAATGSIRFWGWMVLDINRLILYKLFYRGQTLVDGLE